MKLIKRTIYQLLILTTSVIMTITYQADMSAKEGKSQMQTKMEMENSLMVMNGWVRLMPATAKNTAAYFVLHNTTDKDVTIVGVNSKIAKMTMMHDVIIENNMARMVHLDKVIVPAGSQVEFSPSGKHVMFVGLYKKLKENSDIKVMFTLESGEMIIAKMKVKSGNMSISDGHKH